MTETVTDGAGSDPSLLQTTAQQIADGFVINGRKWMITGVPEASINIVMARTLDAKGVDLGATMFIVDMDTPGIFMERWPTYEQLYASFRRNIPARATTSPPMFATAMRRTRAKLR
jgi:alkylation response protein AidB-like acyl-CoA dehydrogenase